jgi:hypothetical protein
VAIRSCVAAAGFLKLPVESRTVTHTKPPSSSEPTGCSPVLPHDYNHQASQRSQTDNEATSGPSSVLVAVVDESLCVGHGDRCVGVIWKVEDPEWGCVPGPWLGALTLLVARDWRVRIEPRKRRVDDLLIGRLELDLNVSQERGPLPEPNVEGDRRGVGGDTGAKEVLAGFGSDSQLGHGDRPVDREHCAYDSEPGRRPPKELSPLHGQSLHAEVPVTGHADVRPPHRLDRSLTPSMPWAGVALAADAEQRSFPYLQGVFAFLVAAGWVRFKTVVTRGPLPKSSHCGRRSGGLSAPLLPLRVMYRSPRRLFGRGLACLELTAAHRCVAQRGHAGGGAPERKPRIGNSHLLSMRAGRRYCSLTWELSRRVVATTCRHSAAFRIQRGGQRGGLNPHPEAAVTSDGLVNVYKGRRWTWTRAVTKTSCVSWRRAARA